MIGMEIVIDNAESHCIMKCSHVSVAQLDRATAF